ncbi:MAG: hypothetical protein WA364_15475 [Candidatus Nitrosopolaris sp.]
MESSRSVYVRFPVQETIEIKEISDIRDAVKRMVKSYAVKSDTHEFSYRLLLPRGEMLTTKAKRIGITAQAEFLLALRRKNLKPNLRDIRYVHDVDHYGWIFVHPSVHDKFCANLQNKNSPQDNS